MFFCSFLISLFPSKYDLLKQAWFALARRDSRIEGFLDIEITSIEMLISVVLRTMQKKKLWSMKVPLTKELTAGNSGNGQTVIEHLVITRISERRFNEKIGNE